MIQIGLVGINMGFFIENAEALITFDNSNMRVLRKTNIAIEDGHLKCIGKDCVKSRDMEVIDGSHKLVMPSLINSFVDPLSIINKPRCYVNNEFSLNELLTRFTCLKHVLNGLAGFISLNRNILEYDICRDLKIHIAYLDKQGSIESTFVEGKTVLSFPYIDLNSDEDLDNLKSTRKTNNWIFIRTPLTRRRFFDIKRITGKWVIELLNDYNLISEKTVLIGLNWVSATDINYILMNKPVILTSPSQSMNLGEYSYLPVKPLLKGKVPLVLFSSDYSLLGFNLYLEYPIFYLLTKFLYDGLNNGYSFVIQSTITTPYSILGLNINYLIEGSKPTLVIFNIGYRGDWFANLDLNPLLFLETTVEYLFIDGEPVLTPSVRSIYVSELKSIMNELFLRGCLD